MNRISLIPLAVLTIGAVGSARTLPFVCKNVDATPPFVMNNGQVLNPQAKINMITDVALKSTENLVKVKIFFKNIDQSDISGFSIYNEDTFMEAANGIHFSDDNQYTFEVKPGIYDICGRTLGGAVTVVKENINVDKDCEFELDFNDATERISFVGKTPFGEDIVDPYNNDNNAPTIDWMGTTITLYK